MQKSTAEFMKREPPEGEGKKVKILADSFERSNSNSVKVSNKFSLFISQYLLGFGIFLRSCTYFNNVEHRSGERRLPQGDNYYFSYFN